MSQSTEAADQTEKNRAIVRAAFDKWAAGGNFLELFDESLEWTIDGSGPTAKRRYHGLQAFIDDALVPISATLAAPMIPNVRGLYADGDTVIVHWDGAAPMKDGQTYRNSYAWFLRMRDGRVVSTTAFIDLQTYDAALQGRQLPAWPD